jgi:hypothetical protein
LKKVIVLFLIVMTLAAGAALVACGGGDKNKEEKTTPVAQETKAGNETPAAKATTSGNKTPAAKATTATGGTTGGSSDSLGDIPVYPGANKITSGEWSGADAPIPAMGGGENPSDFGTVKYGMYETDDGAETVYNWYKDKMSGWKEEWTYGGTSDGSWSGIGIWSKDDGKTAAWITVSEEGGKTSLTIMTGTQ